MNAERVEQFRLLLRKHIGNDIVVHFARDGVSSIMAGQLSSEDEAIGSFIISIKRNVKHHQGQVLVLPQSETEFFPEDILYVQHALETEEEAERAFQVAGAAASGTGGGFGGLQ